MDSHTFAQAWLESEGLFGKDSDYGGMLGKAALEVVDFMAKQGHTGGSMFALMEILKAFYDAYNDPVHPIWVSYWNSDKGKALVYQFGGKEDGDAFLQRLNSEQHVPKPGPIAKPALPPMPNPTPEQIEDPTFLAIWNAIKSWDVNVPEHYVGYCGATGSHVILIFDALKAIDN